MPCNNSKADIAIDAVKFLNVHFVFAGFIFAENSEGVLLKRNIYEHIEYNLVHKNVWNLLHEWYGGGPVFDRTVQIVGYSVSVVLFS